MDISYWVINFKNPKPKTQNLESKIFEQSIESFQISKP